MARYPLVCKHVFKTLHCEDDEARVARMMSGPVTKHVTIENGIAKSYDHRIACWEVHRSISGTNLFLAQIYFWHRSISGTD